MLSHGHMSEVPGANPIDATFSMKSDPDDALGGGAGGSEVWTPRMRDLNQFVTAEAPEGTEREGFSLERQMGVLEQFWMIHRLTMPELTPEMVANFQQRVAEEREKPGKRWHGDNGLRILYAPILHPNEWMKLGLDNARFPNSKLTKHTHKGEREAPVWLSGPETYKGVMDGSEDRPMFVMRFRGPNGQMLYKGDYEAALEESGLATRSSHGRLWVMAVADVTPSGQLSSVSAKKEVSADGDYHPPTQTKIDRKEKVTASFFDDAVDFTDTIETRLLWALLADANGTPPSDEIVMLCSGLLYKRNVSLKGEPALEGYMGLRVRKALSRAGPQIDVAFHNPGFTRRIFRTKQALGTGALAQSVQGTIAFNSAGK